MCVKENICEEGEQVSRCAGVKGCMGRQARGRNDMREQIYETADVLMNDTGCGSKSYIISMR